MITPATRNLVVFGGETHLPHPDDTSKPKCGTASKGAPFRPTLQRVTCHKCGVGRYRLDEFVSWESEAKAAAGFPNVVGTVEDSGDSVTVRTEVRDMPGVELSLDLRIRPEDLGRFIARLIEIKEARGL